jgi:alkylated DNA nucleotide flippase Atl1
MGMNEQLSEILDFLNAKKMRATYGAVAGYLGVQPRSIGAMLGEHSQRASWVVNSIEELPTDYEKENIHPDLLRTSLVIKTAGALDRGLTAWTRPA